MLSNNLPQAASLYLQQHSLQPVYWQEWGEEALALAAHHQKPILLSSGYSACHWCHVMAHESFEDPKIAALINQHFIPVKLDREERPDVDAIYQAALIMMGQQGGWPLTMFLTPDGVPFWGGTYFPPAALQGYPGFPDVLQRMAQAWKDDQEKIQAQKPVIIGALQQWATTSKSEEPLTEDTVSRAAARLVRDIDPFHGGLGEAPKFPQLPSLGFLWQNWQKTGLQPYHDAVVNSVHHMCAGGIYDHLAGGFFRYTVDDSWKVPHFEKMLYDNALFIDLLSEVWVEGRQPILAERVSATIGWMLRDMSLAQGGLAAALDADSDGEEGRFYVWKASEIEEILGAQHTEFNDYYGVTAAGNWRKAYNIFHHSPQNTPEDKFQASRQLLLAKREQRNKPTRDEKMLASWNGLAIYALIKAGKIFANNQWVSQAQQLFDGVVAILYHETEGLFHMGVNGKPTQVKAFLDDYAALARAALALYRVNGQAAYLEWAQKLTREAIIIFEDAAEGGFFTASKADLTLLVRHKNFHDLPSPSGNALMLDVLAGLSELTPDQLWKTQLQSLLTIMAGAAEVQSASMTGCFQFMQQQKLIY
ncbi:MAG: thioredoxin domain-containing protein [Alphaproteobacteria bacterium]